MSSDLPVSSWLMMLRCGMPFKNGCHDCSAVVEEKKTAAARGVQSKKHYLHRAPRSRILIAGSKCQDCRDDLLDTCHVFVGSYSWCKQVGAPQQLMREASRSLLLALFYLPTYIVRDDEDYS
mmetsp:Transcript_61049/g.168918  ORF Transcript_61049/g.168918 Transcript_61049/m.168918 type:complete len:122 (-) Transcript_61049:107-472(-)